MDNKMIMIKEIDFSTLLNKIERIEKRLENLTTERDDKIYNVTETAKILNITPQTLHSYIRAGYVKPIKINGSNKFTREIIESLRTQKHESN